MIRIRLSGKKCSLCFHSAWLGKNCHFSTTFFQMMSLTTSLQTPRSRERGESWSKSPSSNTLDTLAFCSLWLLSTSYQNIFKSQPPLLGSLLFHQHQDLQNFWFSPPFIHPERGLCYSFWFNKTSISIKQCGDGDQKQSQNSREHPPSRFPCYISHWSQESVEKGNQLKPPPPPLPLADWKFH